jgi:hypothetical protein
MQQGGLTQTSCGQAPACVSQATYVLPYHFLIANLELEFCVTRSKQRRQPIPNRKYSVVLHSAFAFPSGLEPQASSLQNPWPPCDGRLIDTPRLEFRANPTKQSLSPNSNRYKMGILRPGRMRGSGVLTPAARQCACSGSSCESPCDSAPPRPSSRATLTLPEPHSNLPASCFVRGFAGEHS